MKLIRWVEEHLSGRSKRNKDQSRAGGGGGRQSNHHQVSGLFYDESLVPLHLKLDSSCRLFTSDQRRKSTGSHQYQLKGECERREEATARPEPYDTIALSSSLRDNGNWMVTNPYSSLETSNPLVRHPPFLRSGHPSTSNGDNNALHRHLYCNDGHFYSNGQMVNNAANCLVDRDEEYLTVYFTVDDAHSASTASHMHSQVHPRSQEKHSGHHQYHHPSIPEEHASILRRSSGRRQQPHPQSTKPDELYSSGRQSSVIDSHRSMNTSNLKVQQFTRADHNRHSHQSYFTQRQINDDDDDEEDEDDNISPPVHPLLYSGGPMTPSTARRFSAERSRIKTNPWLKSPWATPRHSKKVYHQLPCPMSSSSVSGSNGNSSDSGCSLIPSNALVTTSESRTTVDNCNTHESTGVHSSLGVISTPSSTFNSTPDTSPITDEDVNRCISSTVRCTSLHDERPNKSSCTPSSRLRNCNDPAAGTLKCDINKNSLALRSARHECLLNHLNSASTTAYNKPVSEDVSSDSMSSNNNNNSCSIKRQSNSHCCSNHGVRCNNRDESVNNTLTSNCLRSHSALHTGSNGHSSTLTGNKSSSASSSVTRRRKRRSRVYNNCPVNRKSSLALATSSSHTNAAASASSSSSSSSSVCSKSSSPANETSVQQQQQQRNKTTSTLHSASSSSAGAKVNVSASVKRRKSKLIHSAICPSTSSESLSTLPAPPDCVSSHVILQDLLSNLVARSKTSSSSCSSSASSSTSKQCSSSGKSSETTPVEVASQVYAAAHHRPFSWTYSSESVTRKPVTTSAGGRRRRQIDCNDITATDDDNSRVNETTTRQEASCIFSDVTFLPSLQQPQQQQQQLPQQQQPSNDTSSASNLLARKESTSTAGAYYKHTVTSLATDAVSSPSSRHPHPHPAPPAPCAAESLHTATPREHENRSQLPRSPSTLNTLKTTYTEQSNESRNTPPPCLNEKKTRDSNCSKSCKSNQPPTGSSSSSNNPVDRPTLDLHTVQLRRNVKSNIMVNINENRQSAPVFIDSESSCKIPLDATSPMATSMIVINSTPLACESAAGCLSSTNQNISPSVYPYTSSDCFTITPSSSRGSSVSFSRSSSVSSSRPASLVSASAALSAAGRRYYSSLLNKRRFTPQSVPHTHHINAHGSSLLCPTSKQDRAKSSFKRFSLLSNEEWVSAATEELICSDDEEETEEYESETSQIDVNVGPLHCNMAVTGATAASGGRQVITNYDSQLAQDDARSIGNEEEESNVTSSKKVDSRGRINYQSNSYNSEGSSTISSRCKSNGTRSTVTSISMTHDTEMSQCGENKIQEQDQEESAIAAVTASAVSRRRKERNSSRAAGGGGEGGEGEEDSSKKRGVGSEHIRPEAKSIEMTATSSSTFNCSISSSSPIRLVSSSSSSPCPLHNNCCNPLPTGDYLNSNDGDRKSESKSTCLVVSASSSSKEDIHTRRLFEARHLREMRKETKATLMQANENIDSTFSPLQQLKLVSERLEQLLKMQDDTNSSTRQLVKQETSNINCDNGEHIDTLSPAAAASVQATAHREEKKKSDCDRSKSYTLLHLRPEVSETKAVRAGENDKSDRCISSPVCLVTGSVNSQRAATNTNATETVTGTVSDTCPSLSFSCQKEYTSPPLQGEKLLVRADVKSTYVTRPVGASDSSSFSTASTATDESCAASASLTNNWQGDSPPRNHIKLTPSSGETQVKQLPHHQQTKRPISSCSSSSSSSYTSQFDRRIRRTMEHEKLWQDISARFSFDECNISSLLDSFIQTSSAQHTNGVSNVHYTAPSASPSSPSTQSSSSPYSSSSTSCAPVNQA